MISPLLSYVRVVVGFAAMAAVPVCGIWANEVYWKMVDKVNARLPEADRFRPLFWGAVKRIRLQEEYRRLYREGNELTKINRLTTIMFAALGLIFIIFIADRLF